MASTTVRFQFYWTKAPFSKTTAAFMEARVRSPPTSSCSFQGIRADTYTNIDSCPISFTDSALVEITLNGTRPGQFTCDGASFQDFVPVREINDKTLKQLLAFGCLENVPAGTADILILVDYEGDPSTCTFGFHFAHLFFYAAAGPGQIPTVIPPAITIFDDTRPPPTCIPI